MSDHVMIAAIATMGAVLQFGGLIILALQLRATRRETHESLHELVEQGQRHAALLKATIDHLAYLRTQREGQGA